MDFLFGQIKWLQERKKIFWFVCHFFYAKNISSFKFQKMVTKDLEEILVGNDVSWMKGKISEVENFKISFFRFIHLKTASQPNFRILRSHPSENVLPRLLVNNWEDWALYYSSLL